MSLEFKVQSSVVKRCKAVSLYSDVQSLCAIETRYALSKFNGGKGKYGKIVLPALFICLFVVFGQSISAQDNPYFYHINQRPYLSMALSFVMYGITFPPN